MQCISSDALRQNNLQAFLSQYYIKCTGTVRQPLPSPFNTITITNNHSAPTNQGMQFMRCISKCVMKWVAVVDIPQYHLKSTKLCSDPSRLPYYVFNLSVDINYSDPQPTKGVNLCNASPNV